MADTRVVEDRLLTGLPTEGDKIRLGSVLVSKRIGAGGMGSVYLGHDEKLDIDVAVKVLPFHLADTNPGMVDRFVREAQVAARIDHPNLVRVYTVGEESSIHYIVSEFVEGESLHDKLRREKQLDEAEALKICIQVGDALHASHVEGIIHRDVKPANILIRTKDGRIKVADLGLAKTTQEGTNDGLTASGQVMGTPGYMSPEQARDASKVDGRTDIYALGATLYALLTGHPPFEDSQVIQVIMKLLNEEPRPVSEERPDVSDATRKALERLMAKNPDERPAAMDGAVFQLKKALDALKAAPPAARAPRPPSPPKNAPPPARQADEAGEVGETMLYGSEEAPAPVKPFEPPAQGPAQGPARGPGPSSTRRTQAVRVQRGSGRGALVALLVLAAAAGGGAYYYFAHMRAAPSTRAASVRAERDGKLLVVDLGGGVLLRLVRVEPGTFRMGTLKGHPDETPSHEVTIARAFYLAETEIAKGLYANVMEPKLDTGGPADAPARLVSWLEAQKFCKKLAAMTGRSVRLPTEAEWEYACAAGSGAQYSFGDDNRQLTKHAWFATNTSHAPEPVAGKDPNAWGLYDMHGNVAEWCADWYGDQYYTSAPATDPSGPAKGTMRILRGGSFRGIADDCRRSRRHKAAVVERANDWGFRVVIQAE